ncbi:MAG: guanylate kinase [Clostridia bacterium]|nr:guanylate kinase [Clostridia bacterium]MBQ6708520.1 guanylate kinase [Clostridia bacterium]
MSTYDGTLIIFSGPSGSGKDTVLNELLQKHDDVKLSISATTRKPRENEVDGVHYYFISKEDFEKKIDDNEMLEYAVYGDNYYGTPKAPVDKWLTEGKTVILKIEVQGAEKIRKMYPEALSIFIMPPSLAVLEKRIRGRQSEKEEDIIKRLSIAKNELERACEYDFAVINDDLDDAVEDVASIIKAEKLRYKNMKNIISEVKKDV